MSCSSARATTPAYVPSPRSCTARTSRTARSRGSIRPTLRRSLRAASSRPGRRPQGAPVAFVCCDARGRCRSPRRTTWRASSRSEANARHVVARLAERLCTRKVSRDEHPLASSRVASFLLAAAVASAGLLGCQQLEQDLEGAGGGGGIDADRSGACAAAAAGAVRTASVLRRRGDPCTGDFDCCGGLCSGATPETGTSTSGTCMSSGTPAASRRSAAAAPRAPHAPA